MATASTSGDLGTKLFKHLTLNESNSSANSDVLTDDDHEPGKINSEKLPLSLLFKFVKPFNGDRRELTTFIQNCNSAFQLAQPEQTSHLFLYIVAQLSSNVVNEINLNEINSWTVLKSKLRSYYSQERDLTQLYEELETVKQNHNESITQFFKRLENLKNECITAEGNQVEKDKIDLNSIKKSIQRTALRRFILHCKPEISQMLRARDITTLNEAFSIALREEKIQDYTKTQKQHTSQYCSHCKTHTHTTQNCRKKSKQHQQNNSNPSPPSSHYNSNKFCNYCKNKGHEISECRKRQFKEAQRQNQFPTSKVNHLNSMQPSETNVLPMDSHIQEAFTSE